MLSRLEGKLATTLINRTTHHMELTEEGRFFFEQAQAILQQIAQLHVCQRSPAGRLCVNAATPFMLHAIVPHMAEFRERFPHIQLELTTDERNIDPLERRTDVAIRIGQLDDSSLHARPLGSTQRLLVASPDYLKQWGTPTRVEALAHHHLIGFTQPDVLNQWPLQYEGGSYYDITPALSAPNGETLRQLALHGTGIACLSHFLVHEDLSKGRLVSVLDRHRHSATQLINAVYYRNAQLAQRVSCFLDFMQEKLHAFAVDSPPV